MNSLNKKIGIGIVWNMANMFISRGASVVFTLFLAKFLAPEAFGLMAMIAICYALADALMTSGFGQAIIRQKELTDIDLSTAFFTNLAFSLITYLLVFLVAPWAAGFYGQPELVGLIRVTGLVLFVNSLKVVQLALLNRHMDFKSLMRVNSIATVAAGLVAVGMAYAGFGVWSLVAQFMVSAAVSTGMLWLSSPWRPGFSFSIASFKYMFGFGSKLTLESTLNVLYENSYILVIGKLFSPEITGLYYFAKRIRDLIVDQANSAVQQATYPAMALIQDDDADLKRMYRLIIQLLFFVITPALLIISLLAQPLFQIAFNERWLPAVPYLQLLCIAGILFPVHTVNFNMLKVKGRTDLILYLGLIKKGLHLALLAASVPYGITGILAGQIIAMALSCLPYMYYSAALIGYTLGEQLKDMLKPVIAATLAVAATWLLLNALGASAPWAAVIGGLAFAALYLAISHLANVEGYALIKNKSHALLAGRLRKAQPKTQA
ncbi:lipopolysaccharide biosynthesis protein [Pollutimonas bauzanensis]|uniref:Membrane protein involved in the export of O-antigen and teichoic acid n=1 Tax=Pollutimonas bauzanensis TaxID=658167 RepID=A0A1M5X4G2_9BURK|nr:lipopolysaccharide biosynthesis protein [Pollutimonas bauzanensis]SHH94697.1 Membrane protein involved in the export of O-antigen and teichoic acid [Pollutimonas bauzanensis]